MKILFFIDTLTTGGKERRILELIQYLICNPAYEVALVIIDNNIHYQYVYKLNLNITIINRKYIKYDPQPFFKFNKYCKNFKPDIIHTWGKMSTLYAIPTKIIHKIPVVSNMIADSSNRLKSWSLNSFFFKISMFFSDVILSNSQAGLDAYKIKTSKARYIHNGVSMKRFNQNFDIKKEREALGIKTKYIVVMVASFSDYKDYNLFINIAKDIRQIRDDITFIGIGDGCELKHIKQRVKDENINNVLLTGNLINVESIVAASDIGLLCTFSEGISNSIIEYMALCKPVIVTDLIGGSKEIVVEGETGYIIERNSEKIISLINNLLNNEELRIIMGLKGKERIVTEFSIEKMGKEFEKVYNEVLLKNRKD